MDTWCCTSSWSCYNNILLQKKISCVVNQSETRILLNHRVWLSGWVMSSFEKNCCWWLLFWQSEQKLSLESSEQHLSVSCLIILVHWKWLVSYAMRLVLSSVSHWSVLESYNPSIVSHAKNFSVNMITIQCNTYSWPISGALMRLWMPKHIVDIFVSMAILYPFQQMMQNSTSW